MTIAQDKLTVLCVDDNPLVADAVRVKLERTGAFQVTGWLDSAQDLTVTVQRDCPCLVLLDLDMPGPPPLDVARALTRQCPSTRIVVFSGHVRADLIEAALDAGAWGYISKNDADHELVPLLHRVARGELGLSTEAAALLNRP